VPGVPFIRFGPGALPPLPFRFAQPLLLALQTQHARHLGSGEFVHRVVAHRLPEGVISSGEIALLGERAPLLHEPLRGVEDGAAVVQLVLDVGRTGGDGERKFLRGALPLLRILVFEAAFVILLALLRQHRYGSGQQAHDHDE
jgi:hypothetical protein